MTKRKRAKSNYGTDPNTPLTQKQFLFVQEYFKTGNGVKSAIAAGYEAGHEYRTAYTNSSRLLSYAHILRHLREMRVKMEFDTIMTQKELLERLSAIGRGDMSKLAKWNASGVYLKDSDEAEATAKYAVSELSESKSEAGTSVRIKLHDKVKALGLLQKHYELLNAAKQHENDPGIAEATASKVCNVIDEINDAE